MTDDDNGGRVPPLSGHTIHGSSSEDRAPLSALLPQTLGAPKTVLPPPTSYRSSRCGRCATRY